MCNCTSENLEIPGSLASRAPRNDLSWCSDCHDCARHFEVCAAETRTLLAIYALRLNFAKPAHHVILPDVISKEKLAPVVRERDDDWMMIVKWTLYAKLKIPRGLNQLWNAGGIQYAPPIR